VVTLRLEIRDAEGPQRYFWRIKDGDNILARSETMYNKADAVSAANNMKNNTAAYQFEVTNTQDRDYPYSWHAQAGNNRLLVSSTDLYRTYDLADNAKNYVRRNAPYAEIVDMTRTGSRW
jgi:uncharacterized protein YegP (UPF0339 family)